jgi:hypothetical protein
VLRRCADRLRSMIDDPVQADDVRRCAEEIEPKKKEAAAKILTFSGLYWPAMTRIAAAILLLSTTAAPAAILCQDAPGREPGVHWWWRDIDARRCWFKREGPIPPKSEFRWEKEREEAVKAAAPAALAEEQQSLSIRMLKARILWEGISEVGANWIDGDAPVDLMRGDTLSGPAGVGGNWVVPPYNETAGETTSFAARFTPVIESKKTRTN